MYVVLCYCYIFFFFSSRRRHTRCLSDWSSDVCSSDLAGVRGRAIQPVQPLHDDDPGGRPVAQELADCVDGPMARAHEEIGRASCRERGEIWGGAGGVKKKESRDKDSGWKRNASAVTRM